MGDSFRNAEVKDFKIKKSINSDKKESIDKTEEIKSKINKSMHAKFTET